ncbi:hypothetical protein D3C87_2167450 [compost metagenome]
MQLGVDAVELIGMFGQQTTFDTLLQPTPLKRRGLIQAGRRVVVEFQQFRRSDTVI